MPTEVIMPKVDMDMETGRVSAWHVGDGDTVKAGDPLFDIETDKAAMEVESPADGRLGSIAVAIGDDVPIGQTVAWVYADGEEIVAVEKTPTSNGSANGAARTTSDVPSTRADEPKSVATPTQDHGATQPDTSDKPRATPLARRLAKQHGIDLQDLKGTGPSGRISRIDVEGYAESKQSRETGASSSGDHAQSTASHSKLAVHRSGDTGATPVVFLHGLTGDSDTWNKLTRRLGDSHPIVRIDLPGHGRSPRDAVPDFESFVASVLATFDAEGFETLHLVGHSLGGAVAVALADQRPRNVASLTLLAPVGLGPEIDRDVLDGISRASRAESLAPWLKKLVADPDRIGWDYVKAAIAARADEELRKAQADLITTLFPDATQGFDITAMLHRVDAATRIVWGREDTIAPWRHALRAPGSAALHLLPNVGHMPHMEATDLVADILKGQLKQGL